MSNLVALIFPLSVIILILIYGIIVIKRHFIDKKPFKGGTEAAGLGTFNSYVAKDKQAGIEHIQKLKEVKLENDNGEKNIKEEGKS